MDDKQKYDKEWALAEREGLRIDMFVDRMVKEGRMTPAEERLVRAEYSKSCQQAGYSDKTGGYLMPFGEEAPAVFRQANHLQRHKITELHPELKDELTAAIESRRQFPLPKMTPLLDKPGEAYSQWMQLLRFIDEKRDTGEIKHSVAHQAYLPALELFQDNGVRQSTISSSTDKIILVQARHAIEQKLLELCPELADQIRNLNAGREK